jgi:hypothetical protein
MDQQLEQLRAEAVAALSSAADETAVEQARVNTSARAAPSPP